jgi:hypothetical protein
MCCRNSAPRAGAAAVDRHKAISTRKGNARTHMGNVFSPSCIWQAADVPEIENVTAKFSGLLVCLAVPGTCRQKLLNPSLFYAAKTFPSDATEQACLTLRLSLRLIPLLDCYTMNAGSVADVSEVHSASVFRFKVYNVNEFTFIYRRIWVW